MNASTSRSIHQHVKYFSINDEWELTIKREARHVGMPPPTTTYNEGRAKGCAILILSVHELVKLAKNFHPEDHE